MATKSRRSKLVGLLCILLMLIFAAGSTVLVPFVYRNLDVPANAYRGVTDDFSADMFKSGYIIYKNLKQEEAGRLLTPIELFFPQLEYDREDEDSLDQYETLSQLLNQIIDSWETSFTDSWSQYDYAVLDSSGDTIYSSRGLAGADKSQTDANLLFSATVSYDFGGKISLYDMQGDEEKQMENFFFNNTSSEYLYKQLRIYIEHTYLKEAMNYFVPPADVTITYSISDQQATSTFGTGEMSDQYLQNSFIELGLIPILIIDFVLVLILSLVMKYGGKIRIKFAETVHLGTLMVIAIIASMGIMLLAWLGISMGRFEFHPGFWGVDMTGIGAVVVAGILFGLLLFILMLIVMVVVFSLLHIRDVGIKSYMLNQVYLVGLVVRFYRWITSFDASKTTRKTIVKVLVANFLGLVMVILSGSPMVALVVYSVIVYFIIRSRTKKINKSYNELLSVTSNMVEGNFDVEFKEELGVFSPLGAELKKVQGGFKRAIEAETKSQNMRTELITNVSHDLKTPLTAIITYINLLKDPKVTKAERESYLETLEQKSNRLKVLIEDLFEMSKISSGNLEPQLSEVDLVALVKQLQVELFDEIEASSVSLFVRQQQESIKVKLDGEMTYRIFENLMMNAVKYSLADTRAYVDIYTEDHRAVVEIKNTSAAPLEFSLEDLTERFVRGDSARNTEGSGLGLAIAKSFTEAQKGDFNISADGDLFKVRVTFEIVENNLDDKQVLVETSGEMK